MIKKRLIIGFFAILLSHKMQAAAAAINKLRYEKGESEALQAEKLVWYKDHQGGRLATRWLKDDRYEVSEITPRKNWPIPSVVVLYRSPDLAAKNVFDELAYKYELQQKFFSKG